MNLNFRSSTFKVSNIYNLNKYIILFNNISNIVEKIAWKIIIELLLPFFGLYIKYFFMENTI